MTKQLLSGSQVLFSSAEPLRVACDLRFVTQKRKAGWKLPSVLVRNNMFPSGLGRLDVTTDSFSVGCQTLE